MSNIDNHTDDFKKLFNSQQFPALPLAMENQIMAGVEIKKLKEKRNAIPQWLTSHLLIFSLSIFFFASLSVVQFIFHLHHTLFMDLKIMLLLSAGIFFTLWLIESADIFLQRKFSN